MSRQSIVLLSSPPPEVIYQAAPVRVDSWFTDIQHQHTLSIVASRFKGRLIIEASIKVNPNDNDWFPISLGGKLYIDYPRNGLVSETSNIAFSFLGRFVWMRARLDRSYVIPMDAQPTMVAACGFIDRILLNV